MSKIIGIDLGTSNSAAAVMQGGRPAIIPSEEGITFSGGKAFPSVVAFTKDGQKLVGEPARRQAVMNPDGTITGAKRKMGTDFKYKIFGRDYSPQEISAFILQKIKNDAEKFLGEQVEKAVITVPAYFNDNQRQATKDAGEIAGLEVVRIINEPTAASLAYGLDKADKEQTVLVFDFGGGTLDVTILEFGNNVFEVKSTSGDTQLGGRDMDDVVTNFLAKEFQSREGVDLSKDKEAMQRLREAGEKAKIELSTVLESEINLPYLSEKKHFVYKFNRAKLEELVSPIIDRCRKPVRQALDDAKLKPTAVSKVILVGGPTRMPCVHDFVEKLVGKKIERGVDPMECVAMGAAIQAGVLAGEVKDILLLDVTPLSLGIETLGGVFTKLIDRNTTIPTKKSQIFSTAADSQTAVDILVFQGERPMARDNIELGRFSLVGIPPAPRGIPQIEVSFDIDANGLMHVTALDKGTGKKQSIHITAPHKMAKEEIEKKMREAEQFSEEDKKRREEVEARNEADSLVYLSEKTLKDLGDKVPVDKKNAVEESMKKVKEALLNEGGDATALKQAVDDLRNKLQEAGSSVYQQPQGQQQESAREDESGEKEKKDDGVVDAEYREENKE